VSVEVVLTRWCRQWVGDVVDMMLVGDEGDVDGWMVVDLVAGGLAEKMWTEPEMVYIMVWASFEIVNNLFKTRKLRHCVKKDFSDKNEYLLDIIS
nr:hypothetical protein [Tanacetum cinerariifolium]